MNFTPRKLSRLRAGWRRLFFSLAINFLLAAKYFDGPQQAHWVGHAPLPSAPALVLLLLGLVLLAGFPIIGEVRGSLLWAALWGSVLSAYVISISFLRVSASLKRVG